MSGKRKQPKPVRPHRMPRNANVGLGCRTVFASTLEDLGAWWSEHRVQLPVMAQYRPGFALLSPAVDGMDECEWVTGPSVEAVVSVMLRHLGISTKATWSAGEWEGTEWLSGRWNMQDLMRYHETEQGVFVVNDETLSAQEAEVAILRLFPVHDQGVFDLFNAGRFEEFLVEERAARGEGLDDFYGCRRAQPIAAPVVLTAKMNRLATADYPAPRMMRNADLGDGCRTLYLPTLDDLSEWLSNRRDNYPIMGWFQIETSLLEPAPDGNEECEWVIGPSVEVVTTKMLTHLGVETAAQWTGPDSESDHAGYWELPGLVACEALEDAACDAVIFDRRLSASEAEALMLRHVAGGGQDVMHVRTVEYVADYMARECRNRDEGGEDHYGFQNEAYV